MNDPIRISVKCSKCGAQRRIRLSTLTTDKASRCSKCLAGSKRTDRGGDSSSPLYRLWSSMIHRCHPDAPPRTVQRYHNRGITVCDEWATSYETFKAWAINAGWAPNLQIDRRDNSKGYSPTNCQFVTPLRNRDNREATRWINAWGETKLLVAWVDDPRCVVDYHCLWDRLYRTKGWTAERALSTPRRISKNNRTMGANYHPMPR